MKLTALICAATLGVAVAPADAAIVVDQSNLADGTAGSLITSAIATTFSIYAQSQSMTAGLSGRLVGIDLQLARSGAILGATPTFNVSLFDGDSAAQAFPAALLTHTYALSDAPLAYETQKGALFRFDTSAAGYNVQPGRVFTVRIDVEPAYNTGGFGIINGVRVNGVNNYLTCAPPRADRPARPRRAARPRSRARAPGRSAWTVRDPASCAG